MVSSAAMKELRVAVPTSHTTLGELRADIDRELSGMFPPGLLEMRWEDERLVLEGPGANASVTLEDGLLVGSATLGPPASFMGAVIEEKIKEALERVAQTGEHD